jgi:cell division protein FtsN
VDTVVDRPENVRREMRRMVERAILGESVKKQPRQAACWRYEEEDEERVIGVLQPEEHEVERGKADGWNLAN